ncbi:MAG: type II toxin-antitoxin system RelE/ParE family toxin [Alphaproteobacteria bacterium]|nr:type II toxin-antitoxin system RelE/ParE family toxin [Alphaproteobacteria bacterium]
MRIVWSPLARQDLAEIEDYIGYDNPIAAEVMAAKIRQAVERLITFPASGRPGRSPHTRELVIAGTPYIMPYIVAEDEIRIIAVIHTARKWPDDSNA